MPSVRMLETGGLAIGLMAMTVVATVAQDGATIAVAQDGSGDFDTISAAIEAATPGDEILIAPGEYVENLRIDKPLTLRGDGAREDIVLLHDLSDRQIHEMDPDGPTMVTILVDDADVTIERIAIMDEDDRIVSILLDGGESVVRDVYANDFIGVRGAADVIIEDSYVERLGTWGPNHTVATGNEIRDYFFASEGSSGRFENNSVFDLPVVVESGASFEIVDNSIFPNQGEAGIVVVNPETSATVTGNDVDGGFAGVALQFAGESVVEGNALHDGQLGVLAVETPATIRGNTISDVMEVGVVAAGNGMLVSENRITGGRIGIHAHAIDDAPPDAPALETPPRIRENTIADVSHFAIVIEDSSPDVAGNTLCAGRRALQIVGESQPTIGSNVVCEELEP